MSRWMGILLLLSLAGTSAVWADSVIPDSELEDVPSEVLLDLGIDGDMAPGTPVPRSTPPQGTGGYDLPHSSLTERIIWDKTPIRLTLPVGYERLVHFPGPVRVGIPAHINPVLRSQSVDGTVYWQASAPFEPVRVQVHELESGQVYLFDLQAREGASTAPVQILLPSMDNPKPTLAANDKTPTTQPETQLSYVALTRFAAQQMYAPSRLLRELPGINRIPLSGSAPIPLLRGSAVQAIPLIAWHGGGYYLTVVKLRNLTSQPLILDPRDLRGSWLAATFQHARLFPQGDEADTTCVYLISARPFNESLQGMF